MAGPQGLTGLAGLQVVEETTPEATPEEIHGGPADEYHSFTGEQAAPYSWTTLSMPAASTEWSPPQDGLVDYAGDYNPFLAAGVLTDDPTSERPPWTHAAPWPKDPIGDGSVGPDNTLRQVMQNANIHSIDVGGKRNVQSFTLDPLQDDWRELWNVTPGGSDLTDLPGQMKSGAAPGGRGGTDRTQSNAHQNSFGFDSAHMHRRYAAGSIPGNYMWMQPGGRPLVKSLAGPARPPIGQGSQFEGNDLGQAFSIDGAILQSPPVQYSTPVVPYFAPGYSPDQLEGPMGSFDYDGT